ncbi:hypothetical protein MVES1_003502 [Malassezia vespertilionis]|uniref:uncharacterized protein n=1 Tax=Malassezia vespertilionis TaxID=2020962 RepID=UPI0024B220D2|nr:uncharacterized protein MVES1_003502 [Malassezia vespertilionis]WFD08132.1 hypothetical protein MVES1_003502 [Malassezia vespertilionis]
MEHGKVDGVESDCGASDLDTFDVLEDYQIDKNDAYASSERGAPPPYSDLHDAFEQLLHQSSVIMVRNGLKPLGNYFVNVVMGLYTPDGRRLGTMSCDPIEKRKFYNPANYCIHVAGPDGEVLLKIKRPGLHVAFVYGPDGHCIGSVTRSLSIPPAYELRATAPETGRLSETHFGVIKKSLMARQTYPMTYRNGSVCASFQSVQLSWKHKLTESGVFLVRLDETQVPCPLRIHTKLEEDNLETGKPIFVNNCKPLPLGPHAHKLTPHERIIMLCAVYFIDCMYNGTIDLSFRLERAHVFQERLIQMQAEDSKRAREAGKGGSNGPSLGLINTETGEINTNGANQAKQ